MAQTNAQAHEQEKYSRERLSSGILWNNNLNALEMMSVMYLYTTIRVYSVSLERMTMPT